MTDIGRRILEISGVTYYSPLDEAAFFGWLDEIRCVESYQGRLRTLYLTVDLGAVDDDGLRELVALYRRYDVDLEGLRVLDADRGGL